MNGGPLSLCPYVCEPMDAKNWCPLTYIHTYEQVCTMYDHQCICIHMHVHACKHISSRWLWLWQFFQMQDHSQIWMTLFPLVDDHLISTMLGQVSNLFVPSLDWLRCNRLIEKHLHYRGVAATIQNRLNVAWFDLWNIFCYPFYCMWWYNYRPTNILSGSGFVVELVWLIDFLITENS